MVHNGIWRSYYLRTFIGVKLDSHKWFITAPFHVARNLVSHSDLCSVSDVNPTLPTKIKCSTCSGCCKSNSGKSVDYLLLLFQIKFLIRKYYYYQELTFNTYLDAMYPPKECPSKTNLSRFLALRHSSRESTNQASVSVLWEIQPINTWS